VQNFRDSNNFPPLIATSINPQDSQDNVTLSNSFGLSAVQSNLTFENASHVNTTSPALRQHDDANTNVQPMTISQTIQVIQDYQPQSLSDSLSKNVVINECSFYYKACIDFTIYRITCEEISFELVSQLLSNHDCSIQNHVPSNNFHVFYYQQPDDKKIYKVVCEMVFSKEHKKNLEFHLKRDLNHELNNVIMSNNNFNDQSIVNTSQHIIASQNVT